MPVIKGFSSSKPVKILFDESNIKNNVNNTGCKFKIKTQKN